MIALLPKAAHTAEAIRDELRRRTTELRAAETQSHQAYSERNRLVAFLARCYPSGVKRTAIEGWDPEWHGCVFIDTPEGQMSWHYHDSDAALFEGLPPYTGDWDGHTTPEKYERLARLRR